MTVLKGIDISNWQAGFDISAAQPGFVVAKATEGTTYVDRYCDGFIQDCIKHDIPFGFYHFARFNDAATEAKFFYENTRGYIGQFLISRLPIAMTGSKRGARRIMI